MKIIKSKTIKHATVQKYGHDEVVVTMLQSHNGFYYVVKETYLNTVWEIEMATKHNAQAVYDNLVSLAKLAAGL